MLKQNPGCKLELATIVTDEPNEVLKLDLKEEFDWAGSVTDEPNEVLKQQVVDALGNEVETVTDEPNEVLKPTDSQRRIRLTVTDEPNKVLKRQMTIRQTTNQ